MHRIATLVFLLTLATGQACAISVGADARPETCNNTNGYAWCSVSGGQPPYTYAWTGPNGFTASTDSIFGLDAGTYTITVTDNLGATANSNIMVNDLASLPNGFGPTWAGAGAVTGYWGGACEGQCNGAGAFVDQVNGGTPPFSYDFSVSATYLGMTTGEYPGPVYSGFCFGENVSYTMTDALGCTGEGWFAVYGVDGSWNPLIQVIQGACTGANNGSISGIAQSPTGCEMYLSLDGAPVSTQSIWSWGAFTFSNLAPGTYLLESAHSSTQCTTSMLVTVPDLGPDCGAITGTSWYDMDTDCVQDAGEVGIAGSVLLVQPGNQYIITNGGGHFSMNLPAGNYTLQQTDPNLVPNCPATLPAPFTINGSNATVNLGNTSTLPLDLRMHATDGAARPGFDYHMHASASNPSPQVSGPVTVTCTYDAQLTFVSVVPTPTDIVGNTLTWELPAFNIFGAQGFHVILNVPVPTPLGNVLSSTWSVTNTLPDGNLANNTDVITRIVTGSYDPNVKEVSTSSGQSTTQYFVGTDGWLDYTIHFQNTGTDTAFTVVVTDTLDAELDMASFQQGAASHAVAVDFLPGRVVRWTFNNILLVDSITNEPLSHGLTSFRIRLHEPVLPGITVTNAADIFFDFNPPIRTPDVVVVTETSTGAASITSNPLRLVPNPAHDRVNLVCSAPPVRARIRAADGRIVLEQALAPGYTTLDIGALAAGSYVVEATTAIGAVKAMRLVRQ